MPHAFKPGDKVVVFQHDGKERRGIVILTETLTTGNKVRIQSGDSLYRICRIPPRWEEIQNISA
jgi:hypothetical protein